MALFAGETILLTHTAQLDGVAVTNADVHEVVVLIHNAAGTEIIAGTDMVWNSTKHRWEYYWDTSPGATPVDIDAGTYFAKVTIIGLDGSTNFEFKRIRLKTKRF